MSINHKDLTGSDLHEPKGIEVATSGQVYVSDGAGSGSWSDPLAEINNLNSFDITGVIPDISDPNSNFMHVLARDGILSVLRTVIDAPVTVADAVLSIYRNGVLLGQTLTVAFSGSAKGITDVLTLSPTYTFTMGDTIEIRTDGGSTDTAKCYCTLVFTA